MTRSWEGSQWALGRGQPRRGALLFSAWDYVPWLTSPTVIGGVIVTLVAGTILEHRGVVRTRQIAFAILLGGVGFGLSLVVVFFAFLAIWFRPSGA